MPQMRCRVRTYRRFVWVQEMHHSSVPHVEQSPKSNSIKALEAKLDKAVMKHNEASGIEQQYELILERLKVEKLGWNNQVTI